MADRYWVGGTAAWNGTAGTKWALTSGGAGGQAVPTSADDVFFSNLSTGTCTISTGNTGAKSINCTGFTGTLAGTAAISISGSVTLVAGMTFTYNGTLTLNGTGTITSAGKTFGPVAVSGSGITVTLSDPLTLGISSVFTLNAGTINLNNFALSVGRFASNNNSTRSINFGSANIALTDNTSSAAVLQMDTATGFTWTGTGGFTRNQVFTTSVVFGTTDGSVSNAPNLTVSAGSSLLTITANSWFKNLNFTGSTCTVTSGGNFFWMAGSLTLSSSGTYTSLYPIFRASGTITSAGRALAAVSINTVGVTGATVTLADALTVNSSLALNEGIFTASNFNVTANNFSSGTSSTRTINMGSGVWTMTGGVGGTDWGIVTTGLTLNPGTSTITMTSSSAKTFAGGGLTYYNLNQGGAGALTISGSNTFNNITNSTQPATVTFTAGTTQTVSNFGLSGTAGNLVTINSTTPGSQFTLSSPSGAINAQYLSIQDSNATGGATWNAPLTNGNIDAGNNTGWNFVPRSNMFLMFI